MKMTKKIFGAAAAVAMVLGFASCDWSLSDAFQGKFGTDIFTYTDATADAECGKWTVEGENTNEDDYVRGMQFLTTKHSDLSGIVEIESNADEEVKNGGVIGLVFDATKETVEDEEGNKTDLYSFGVVGIRNYNGQPQYYVSYFANITDESFNKANMGANNGTADITKPSVDLEVKTPYEVIVKAMTNLPTSLIDENGNLKVAIDVKENDETGDYDIGLYDKDQLNRDSSIKADAETCGSAKILAETLKKEGPAQAKVGVYGNVYRGRGEEKAPTKLNGSLTIFDFTNAANVAE